jgi:large repetitive protein
MGVGPCEWSEVNTIAAIKEGFVMNTLRRIPRVLVKVVAAGTVMVAAALPVAVMGTGTAGAATSPSLACSQLSSVFATDISGNPYCGSLPWTTQNSELTFYVQGANLGFANGPATATTNATGVTVTGFTELNTFSARVTIAVGSTVTPGYYGLTITDGNGTATLATAYGVDPASQVTSYTPTSIPEGSTTLITVTGSGLSSGTVSAATGGNISVTGGVANGAGTSLTFYATASASLALGTYGVDITGVNTTNVAGDPGINLTVSGASISTVSPSEFLTNAGPAVASTLTISGSGFAPGAIVRINGNTLPTSPVAGFTFGPATIVNTTTITVPVTNASADASTTQWNVSVTNPDGTNSTLVGAIGWNEAGTAPATSSATLTLNSNGLAPGSSTVTVTGSATFPMSLGNVVTLTYGTYSFSGTVIAVSGSNQATIAFDLPASLSTTTTAAVIAGATAVPVANLSGVPIGDVVTFEDNGDTTTPSGTNALTNSITVPALANGHASGTTIQWPISDNLGWTLSVNNGTSSLSLAGLNIAAQPAATLSYLNTAGALVALPYPMTLAPGTYTVLLNDPGANLTPTGDKITFSTGGTNPANITGTIVATSADSAWVTITMPGNSASPTYTAVNGGADTLTNSVVAGQSSIAVADATGLSPGGTYEIGNGSAGSEAITISNTWDGSSTTLPLSAPLTLGHASGVALYSITFPQPTGVNYSATTVNANGQTNTIPFLTTASNDFSFTCISLTTSCPASPGLVLGAGASHVTVNLVGSFTDLAATDYVITSSTPGVTFGGVTAVSATTLTTSVSIKAGTAVMSNIQYQVVELNGNGTYALPNSGQTNTFFLIGNSPTITAVTGLPTSMVPGETSTFSITGTLFDATTVSTLNAGNSFGFFADAGNLAGSLDTGSELGLDGNGVQVSSCVLNSSTSITCSVYVGHGATNGAHDLVITDAGYGTATFANALNVVNATVGKVTPSVYQADGSTVTFTLSGLTGFNVGQDTSSMHVSVDTFSVNGTPHYGGTYAVTYAGPNTVTVNIPGTLVRPPGGLMVIALRQDPSASGYAAEADAPVISLGLPLDVTGGPVAVTPAGTSSGFAIGALNASGYGAPFDGPTAFQQGATVTAPAGSGVSVSGLTVLAGLITGTVTVAPGTPGGNVTLTVTNPDGGIAYTYITVSPSPVITSVNGVSVISGPVSFLSGSTATLTILGANFEAGAVVSSSVAGDATFGTASVNAAGTVLTVSATFVKFSGATPLSTNLVVTNPDGGVGTVPGELVINPLPAVTGGPYYVPTFTTNSELVMTGTGFQAGMTVTSSNADYTVSIANVLPNAVTLLVTTDSAATSGTSTTLTFTNPDGGSTTVQLNGGPVPVPVVKPKFTSIHGRPAHVGKTTTFVIIGKNLSGMSASANKKGVSVRKIQNNATSVTVKVTVGKNVKPGTAKLRLHNSNGQLLISFSIKK